MSRSTDSLGNAATLPAKAPGGAPEASLPVASVTQAPAAADFVLGETLGTGGMGHVIDTEQRALHRQVAAKFLRSRAGDASTLVREAIVTGRLEHPNIVPVHLLAETADGTPFFVMKRVEGTPWSEALARGQPLVDALEVLLKVCDAVAFAHSRRVLHRDLKPSNVLLGPFGEVYLVDWGLAVSLVPDAFLPLASSSPSGGTPAYLAPEMAGAPGGLTERTDVYLLGATLYEVLARRPPRQGGSVEEALAAARAGELPPLPPSVPRELAGLCLRAMAAAPSARPPDAAAFKQELLEYLRHREAIAFYEQAQHRLVQLEQVIGQKQAGGEASALGLTAHAAFSECRFGFEQVRRLWPEFDDARRGLEKALLLMAWHELDHHDPRAARILLAQLPAPPAALLEAITRAEAEQVERQARLAALERDAQDREIDLLLAEKRLLSLAFGTLTLVGALGIHALVERGHLALTTGLGVLVFSVPLLWSTLLSQVFFRSRRQNAAQRRIVLGFRLSALSSVSLWLVAWRLGVPPLSVLPLYYVAIASNWMVAAVLFSRHGWPIAAGSAAAAVLSLLFPAHTIVVGGACAFLGFGAIAWIHGRPSRPRA